MSRREIRRGREAEGTRKCSRRGFAVSLVAGGLLAGTGRGRKLAAPISLKEAAHYVPLDRPREGGK